MTISRHTHSISVNGHSFFSLFVYLLFSFFFISGAFLLLLSQADSNHNNKACGFTSHYDLIDSGQFKLLLLVNNISTTWQEWEYEKITGGI